MSRGLRLDLAVNLRKARGHVLAILLELDALIPICFRNSNASCWFCSAWLMAAR